MRAGGLQDVTTFYRNDRTPTAGTNPHGFLLDPTLTGRNLGQAQVLDFLASGGETISDPDGPAPVFEVPIADPASLETLNFARTPATGEPPPEAAAARDGLVHRRRHGLRRALRGARRLREREGPPARAPGALRLLAPRAGPRDGRGLPGVGRPARRRQPADRPLHGPQAVVHLERRARPRRPAVRPLPRARGARASATSGASRCAAATAASALGRSFYRRRSCDLLTQYKLGSPVFGGRTRKPLARSRSGSAAPARRVRARAPRRRASSSASRPRVAAAHTTYRLRAASRRGSRAAPTASGSRVHGGPGTVRSTLSARRL